MQCRLEIIMKSFRAITSLLVKWVAPKAALALTATLLLSLCAAYAQQPAVGRKKAPSLTTDDVIQPVTEPPPAESPKEPSAVKPENAANSDSTKSTTDKAQASEPKVNAEEASWRERVSKARERAKALQQAAEEAELRVTRLRNDLSASGESAKFRNETAAQMEQAGQQLSELRNQARTAADDLSQLVDYGRQKGFSEASEPKATSEDGKANEEYYRTKYAALNEALQTADRRIQLYENRVRDLQQHILQNGGKKGGDNFYSAQLQEDREEAQRNLDQARTARDKARNDVDALMEEARRAGISPGVFR
jgi:chromosome segregation ATPase